MKMEFLEARELDGAPLAAPRGVGDWGISGLCWVTGARVFTESSRHSGNEEQTKLEGLLVYTSAAIFHVDEFPGERLLFQALFH